MGVKLKSLFGNAAIGPYLSINNEFLLVPKITPEETFNSIKSAFPDDFSIYRTMCNQSALLGSYVVMNSAGIVVPSLMLDEEIEELKLFTKDSNMNINVIESKDNALGNLILSNNKGAIISKSLSKNISTICPSARLFMNSWWNPCIPLSRYWSPPFLLTTFTVSMLSFS